MSLSQEPLPTPGRPATDICSLVLQKIGWKYDYFVSRCMFFVCMYVCMYCTYVFANKLMCLMYAFMMIWYIYIFIFVTHTKYTDIYVCNDECMFLSTIINLIRLYLLLVNRIVSYEQLFEEAKRR